MPLTTQGSHNTGIGSIAASALLVVMGCMWGLQFSMLKLAASAGYSEITVLMVALILLSLVFSLGCVANGERLGRIAGLARFLLITSILGYVVPLAAALHAAPHISAGLLSLTACMSPVVAVLVALILRSEPVSAYRIAAVVLGLAAVLIVLWPEVRLPGRGDAWWIALALIVPIAYGFESVYIARYWPAGLSTMLAVTGETVVAALVVLPLYLVFGDALPARAQWGAAEAAIGVFVLAGVVESLLYFYLIRRTGGVYVNFATFVSLFAGIAWGMVLFGETHTLYIWIAAGLLLAALALANWRRTPIKDDAEPAP